MRKWISACLIAAGATGAFAGLTAGKAAADDAVLNVKPAVLQTNGNQTTSATVQPVRWRGYYRGGYWGGPRVRVYAGPRYYGGYGYYRPYGYGYAYPRYYGYGYPYYGFSYGYGPYYGGYYW
jgi:hypothetical protein